MANTASPPLLMAAARVYNVLLWLYPRAHRLAYGPPMAQLFRDLCRDAHQQGGVPGLVRLWLRTLVDLAVSAVREHVKSGGTTMEDILKAQGLVPALSSYANGLAAEKAFTVHLEVEGSVPRLRAEAESVVLGFVQEATANAKKYAQADNLWIAVRCQEDTLSVRVRDDGRGFDVETLRPVVTEADIGKRAQSIQGELFIKSAIGEGTSIELAAPLVPNLA
jgi:nitrate/nitrite-specific signal transduction histidine kinase